MFDTEKSVERLIIFGGLLIIVLLLLAGSIRIINPNERGLMITLGNISGELQPGLHLKLPLLQSVTTYPVSTQSLKIEVPVAERGAITKDNQTIGGSIQVFYRLNADQIKAIKTQYGLEQIERTIRVTTEQKFKELVGQMTIFDIAANQNKIAADLNKVVQENMVQFPFVIENVQITNYDWSETFDNQIAQTMSRAQQVKQKEQELLITEKEAQKIVKEAEAKKQAAALDAESKALAGEGIRRYNEEIAKTIDIEKQFRALEIEKIRAEKWNGVNVPSQVFTPIPLNLQPTMQK